MLGRAIAPESISLQLRLQATPESVQLLRERLCLWLDELGAGGEEVFDVALASTEAFANAVEHPCRPSDPTIDLRATALDGDITITIQDHGSWRTERQREDGGFGLPLTRSLMDTVEIDAQPGGTSITLRRQLKGPTE